MPFVQNRSWIVCGLGRLWELQHNFFETRIYHNFNSNLWAFLHGCGFITAVFRCSPPLKQSTTVEHMKRVAINSEKWLYNALWVWETLSLCTLKPPYIHGVWCVFQGDVAQIHRKWKAPSCGSNARTTLAPPLVSTADCTCKNHNVMQAARPHVHKLVIGSSLQLVLWSKASPLEDFKHAWTEFNKIERPIYIRQ